MIVSRSEQEPLLTAWWFATGCEASSWKDVTLMISCRMTETLWTWRHHKSRKSGNEANQKYQAGFEVPFCYTYSVIALMWNLFYQLKKKLQISDVHTRFWLNLRCTARIAKGYPAPFQCFWQMSKHGGCSLVSLFCTTFQIICGPSMPLIFRHPRHQGQLSCQWTLHWWW